MTFEQDPSNPGCFGNKRVRVINGTRHTVSYEGSDPKNPEVEVTETHEYVGPDGRIRSRAEDYAVSWMGYPVTRDTYRVCHNPFGLHEPNRVVCIGKDGLPGTEIKEKLREGRNIRYRAIMCLHCMEYNEQLKDQRKITLGFYRPEIF